MAWRRRIRAAGMAGLSRLAGVACVACVACALTAGCSASQGPQDEPTLAPSEVGAVEPAGIQVPANGELPERAQVRISDFASLRLPDPAGESGPAISLPVESAGADVRVHSAGEDAVLVAVAGSADANYMPRALLRVEQVSDSSGRALTGWSVAADDNGGHVRITLGHGGSAALPITVQLSFQGQVGQRIWRDDAPPGAPASGGFALRMIPSDFARAARDAGYLVYLEETGRAELAEALGAQEHGGGVPASIGQQWDCHVLGLALVDQVDLESWRRDNPGWRSSSLVHAIGKAITSGDPAALAQACNW